MDDVYDIEQPIKLIIGYLMYMMFTIMNYYMEKYFELTSRLHPRVEMV